MTKTEQRQQRFLDLANQYKEVIAKVCSVYASPAVPFADLYQEVMVNLWTGLDSFRGDAKASTWIYRVALNTCLTWLRNNRHQIKDTVPIDSVIDIPDPDDDSARRAKYLYSLIAKLDPFDKALVTLWLDEKSYDEISAILGISKQNVATRLHRVRGKLSSIAEQ